MNHVISGTLEEENWAEVHPTSSKVRVLDLRQILHVEGEALESLGFMNKHRDIDLCNITQIYRLWSCLAPFFKKYKDSIRKISHEQKRDTI